MKEFLNVYVRVNGGEYNEWILILFVWTLCLLLGRRWRQFDG